MSYLPSLKPARFAVAVGILFAAAVAQAQNAVTFQVDMTSVPGATDVFIRGGFNGWGVNRTDQLTNNGAGIYSGTFDVAGNAGDLEQCKFYYNPGGVYEDGDNRQFLLAGGDQVLPLTAWNDKYPAPTNNVTFQVDMTAQVFLGNFSNGLPIRVSGVFNGWGDGTDLTNNPALSGNASNIYSAVVPVTGFPGGGFDYKFRANGGWESPASTSGNNRHSLLTGGDQVLPLVFYNDASPCDLLAQATPVTFRLQITNGTMATDGTAFDRSVNHIYINGDFLGWWQWNDGVVSGANESNEMTNNPVGSDFYEQTFLIPRGNTLAVQYKYSMDGYDNEAGFGLNHIRYIRGTEAYTMPLDGFGTNSPIPAVEQSFGDLKIGAPTDGLLPITWLGRSCVTLQTKSDLNGEWQDLPATEATSSTNWPVSGTAQFFRLLKKD
jgi:hypothetical protein